MSDSPFQGANIYQSVILVHRAFTEAAEIIHDGVRVVFKPGEVEKPVPQFLAEWLFQTDKETVAVKGGGRARRFGIKDPSDELLQALGAECSDCDPVEIDHGRLENWDVESYIPGGRPRKAISVSRDPADYQNLAAAGTYGVER